MEYAFSPTGPTKNIIVTGASQSLFLANGKGANTVRCYNAGSTLSFISFTPDEGAAVTLASGMPLVPGVVEVFAIPTHCYINIIGTGGTSYFTPGAGN